MYTISPLFVLETRERMPYSDIKIISDEHFNHPEIVSLCSRPEDHSVQILRKLQTTVAKDDLVIHLGDFSFNPDSDAGIIKELPGHHILVLGNHDLEHPLSKLEALGFDDIVPHLFFEHIYFSHTPCRALPKLALMNIHGHLHNCTEENLGVWFPGENNNMSDFNILYSAEKEDYTPIPLAELVTRGFNQIRTNTNMYGSPSTSPFTPPLEEVIKNMHLRLSTLIPQEVLFPPAPLPDLPTENEVQEEVKKSE